MSTLSIFSARGEALAQGLEDVFREHAQLMYRTAISMTGSRQDAEDVPQTIFLRLLQRGVPLEFRRSSKSYLYRAAVNLSLDLIRSRKRRTFIHEVELLQTPAPEATDEDDAIQRHLLDAIAKLKPRAVEILILHYEHNYSDAEIATMLGKSRGAIAVTLYRARARLKKFMLRATSSEGPSGGKR